MKQTKDIIEDTISKMQQINPSIEVERTKYTESLVYYTACVIQSEIVVEKHTRTIYKNDDAEKLLKNKYLTGKEAIETINKVMPKALEKFEMCLGSYRKLCNELGFCVGFHYEGDTYGVYNEYEYISFKMDDFDFQFKI